MLVSNITLLFCISYKAEISKNGEEGKYNICGYFEKTEKYHSEPTDHSLQEEKKSFKIERETGRKNLKSEWRGKERGRALEERTLERECVTVSSSLF